MSKYQQRGAYHFKHFATPGDPYREHVLDLLRVVSKHLSIPSLTLDVGCGEGLILSKFKEHGYTLIGCDVDTEAVRLAKEKDLPVHHGTIDDFVDTKFDAVFLLDCLEHMIDHEHVLSTAFAIADLVVVALPSVHDAHACCNPTITPPEGWAVVHKATRHARHLTILKRSMGDPCRT